ncbi:MAG: hypothetical protein WAW90_00330 [Minisyncoccia bacterium]
MESEDIALAHKEESSALRYGFMSLLVFGSVMGTWYAFPMLNVVSDEMYFVGGVLRAMQNHTLIPLLYDVPYGTLTFYLNYIWQIPFLLILLALNSGHVSGVYTQLIVHPEYGYLVTRLVSAGIAIGFAFWFERFLRREGIPMVQRFAVLSVPFMTIMPATILHTGKVWVLSSILVMMSLCLLYRSIRRNRKEDQRASLRDARMSIVLAALAFANFPLAGIFLITLPILLIVFRKDTAGIVQVLVGTVWGVVLVALVAALNFKNIIFQITDVFTHYHPVGVAAAQSVGMHISTFFSLILHVKQVAFLFPLTLILIVYALMRNAVQNRLLFFLSAGYAILYFSVIVVLVTWSSDSAGYLRYLFPLAFFFSGMVASLDFKKLHWVLYIFCTVQVVVYGYTLYLLSAPTTFNVAAAYVTQTYHDEDRMLIYNNLGDLDLPRNTRSAFLTQEKFCASKCQYYRSATTTNTFSPTVVGEQSDWSEIHLKDFSSFVWINDRALTNICAGEPVAIFTGGTADEHFASIDYNFGNYLVPRLWHLPRLGKNIYLYHASSRCIEELHQSSQ